MTKKKPAATKSQPARQNQVEQQSKRPVSDKRLFWWLFAIAFVLYAGTLGHGFVLDDLAVIEQNAYVQQGFAGIPKLFTTFYWEGYWDSNAGLYRPLSMVLFAIEWGISPNNPFLHHLVNVLLYALTIGLIYRVVRLLLPNASHWLAFATALLFAVHPIHTEVVANIKSRDEILCLLFFLLTFRYVLKSGLSSLKDQLIAGGLFFLCLLSKEAGILFLPVFALYFLLFQKATVLSTTKRILPLLLIAGGWLALHQGIINSSAHERITYTYLDNSLVSCPDKVSQVATGFGILGRYLWKAVAPVNMSYDYSYNQIPCETLGSPLVIGTLIALAGLLFLVWKTRKTTPVIAFGILFFLITIALATNIFTLIGTTMGDRLLYTPSLGICLVITAGLFHVFKVTDNLKAAHSGMYIILGVSLIFGLMAFRRNRDWASNETLFTADVAHAPGSARVHFNYGTLMMNQLPEDPQLRKAQLPEVIEAFERALAIDSSDNGTHVNLGVCYNGLGDYEKSIYHSKAALKQQPKDVGIITNLGDAYFNHKQYQEAIATYQKIIGNKTTTVATFNRMGTACFNIKDYPKAIEIFQKGLKKDPDHLEMRMNLANCLGASGQLLAARDQLLFLLRKQPGNQQAIQLIVMLSEQLGDQKTAAEYRTQLAPVAN